MTTLYTIGHSNHEISKFINLLKNHNIKQLVDVRSAPYSRYNPHFNREKLRSELSLHGIEYFYAGQYLGGRPADPSCYKHQSIPREVKDYLHEVDYPEIMKKPFFLQGIQQLITLADQTPTAIMCSEENPAKCHRHHLIAEYFLANHPDYSIFHIRGNGDAEDARSIDVSGKNETEEQPPLFSSKQMQEPL